MSKTSPGLAAGRTTRRLASAVDIDMVGLSHHVLADATLEVYPLWWIWGVSLLRHLVPPAKRVEPVPGRYWGRWSGRKGWRLVRGILLGFACKWWPRAREQRRARFCGRGPREIACEASDKHHGR
jgi:hypothetical protein